MCSKATISAGFLLILGSILLLVHRKQVGIFRQWKPTTLLAAAFAAIVLPLLIYSWLDLTVSRSMAYVRAMAAHACACRRSASLPRRRRIAAGPSAGALRPRRASSLRWRFGFAAWAALFLGVLVLHNGEILLVLLAPYLAVFCLFQRTGMDVVRKSTGSPLAAALFGAILLAGFSVVVFPIT